MSRERIQGAVNRIAAIGIATTAEAAAPARGAGADDHRPRGLEGPRRGALRLRMGGGPDSTRRGTRILRHSGGSGAGVNGMLHWLVDEDIVIVVLSHRFLDDGRRRSS